MKHTQLLLLKTRRFLPLFITQFLGALNDNVFKNALIILITYRIGELAGLTSQSLVALAAGIFILPFFLFSATAGQLADKYEKSRLIKILKFIEILLTIIATVGFYFQNIFLLLFILFALGAQATFFGPLKYAILPDHLNENELIAGNGLIEAGTFIAILLGTILGGMFILYPSGEYIISSIMLVIAISGRLASGYIPKTLDNPKLEVHYRVIEETLKLIRYSKERRDIFLSILGISWFWLVGATFLLEFPIFTKDVLHANEHVITYFLTLFSIGLALGSLLCNKLLKGKIHATYVPLGVLGITLFTIDLYFASKNATTLVTYQYITLTQFLQTVSGLRISLDLLLLAICGGLYSVPLYAILQHRSEKPHRARVIASNNVMNALFMVIASVAVMIILKLGFSITQIFLILAIANGLVAIYICKLLPDILIKSFFRWIFATLYRVKVIGLENYDEAGERVVIIANHTSFIDALLLAVFLPDKPSFAVNLLIAKKWWVRLFLRLVDAYPIDPTNPMAIKSLIDFVKQNKRCIIFPEGRLTMTGALMKIYEGPGMVADKSGAKLLPIRIDGAQFTPFTRLRGKVHIHLMPDITLIIFPPQTLDLPPDVKGRKRRHLMGSKLYDVMTNMMFESSHYQQTLFQSLIHAKRAHGAHHEIMEDIERDPITYQKFIMRCFILGGLLAKQTKPQEYVGVLLPNMISNVTTFFALQAFCRIPAMLNYTAGIHNVCIACKTAQIKTIYTSRVFIQIARLTPMIEELNQLKINIVYLEDIRSQITIINKIKGFFFALFPNLAYQWVNSKSHLNADAAAVVLFTSGSEGTPKGVVLSHRNIQANRYQLSAVVDFTASDTVLNALPLFHSFGLTGGTLLPLLCGVKIFFYPSPLHYRIIPELAYDTNATILFGTDTFLAGYAKHAHQYDFYSVRYVFAGAEKLREETRMLWSHKFGVRIFEGYGATETSPIISTNTPMQNKVGTVGRFLPGIHFQLIPIPGINQGGVLHVSGPNIMKGYLLANHPGVLIPPQDGWYDTGDIVSIDEEGFITIEGRVKRFAKIAGEMISLTMVEQLINQLWPLYQHAVIAIADAKKGEQLVVATTYPNATREEIIAYAKTHHMSEMSIPKKIFILTKMPLLGSGKIDYIAVKDILLRKP